jgi:N-acetyl-alpha-D-muramate 1-phosphate uridylyltransferase
VPADLAGIVLAAGSGTRLRPLTSLRPKALCPVGGVPLLDLALARLAVPVGTGPDQLAANACHLGEQIAAHLDGRCTVRVEPEPALGTAGGIAGLRDWVDGRDVLVTNADSYLPGGLPNLLDGWDGERSRLLCAAASGRPDFIAADGTPVRYIGTCLLPWSLVEPLAAEPTGLYEVLWRSADQRGELDLVIAPPETVVIDCGSPADYLAANLHASNGSNVIGAGATVLGRIERSVVWDGAWVGPDEVLTGAIRAGDREQPVTVTLG